MAVCPPRGRAPDFGKLWFMSFSVMLPWDTGPTHQCQWRCWSLFQLPQSERQRVSWTGHRSAASWCQIATKVKNFVKSVEKAVWLTPSLPLLPPREEAHSTAAVHHGTNTKECVIWRQCIKLFWNNFSQMPQQCRIMTFIYFCSFPATAEASRISFSSLFMWSNHSWGHQCERRPHLTCRWRPSSASAAVTEEVMMGCHHWTDLFGQPF